METLLTQSRKVGSSGWEFTALRNHKNADGYPGTARGAYILESPEQMDLKIPEMATETAQTELRGVGGTVVTFDPEVAAEFPSIRLLLPGDPLFDGFVSMTTRTSDDEVVFICGYQQEGSERVVTESRYEETDSADVILPAIRGNGCADLPEGSSLPSLSEGRETVREWLGCD